MAQIRILEFDFHELPDGGRAVISAFLGSADQNQLVFPEPAAHLGLPQEVRQIAELPPDNEPLHFPGEPPAIECSVTSQAPPPLPAAALPLLPGSIEVPTSAQEPAQEEVAPEPVTEFEYEFSLPGLLPTLKWTRIGILAALAIPLVWALPVVLPQSLTEQATLPESPHQELPAPENDEAAPDEAAPEPENPVEPTSFPSFPAIPRN